MAHILVADDSPELLRFLDTLLRAAGHAVVTATDGLLALAAVRRSRPEVVITDMQMPGLDGLQLVDILRAEFPGLPVVLCTGEGSEELAVEALKAGAVHYVTKRKLLADAVPVLDEVLAVALARRKQTLFLDCMATSEHTFVLANDPDLASMVVGHVETVMKQFGLFDPGEHVRVGVAVQEAVVNAVVHGNLEVSSDLKRADWDAYHAAIARRAQETPYKGRRVTVVTKAVRGAGLTVRVRDEGPGFDPAALPDPTDPLNIEKGSGRGLLLIHTFFDRVTHNRTGNEITMEKGGAG
jgi:CheY-like chemotaxis protein/anti-sigma regulatory factor (Ser/Thr protein kinase)